MTAVWAALDMSVTSIPRARARTLATLVAYNRFCARARVYEDQPMAGSTYMGPSIATVTRNEASPGCPPGELRSASAAWQGQGQGQA